MTCTLDTSCKVTDTVSVSCVCGKSLQTVTAAMKLKDAPWKESYDKPRHVGFKKERHHFANKGPYIQRDFFFLVITYRCKCWTKNKAECKRIDAVEL